MTRIAAEITLSEKQEKFCTNCQILSYIIFMGHSGPA